MRSYTNSPTTITPVNSVSEAIANPRQGDWMFFDIDKLLLNTAYDQFGDGARLTEASLAADIRFLRETGVKAIGLTARERQLSSKTLKQLATVGIELEEILYAPNIYQGQATLPTKGKAAKDFLLEQAEHGNKPERIYAFDDIVENLEDIQTALQDIGIPFYGKHYIPAQYQPIHINADTDKVFPRNLEGYKVVRSLGGGSQSVYELQHEVSGNRLVIKFGTHEDSAKLEILSNAVYHAMGVAVPKMRVYHTLPKDLAIKLGLNSPYGMFKVCEYIGNDQENNAQVKVIKEAASRNFVAHVLMGNIDVAEADNYIVNTDGVAHLIDAGANFIFRSMGMPRKEQPELASEIDSLRNKKINSTGSIWFAAIDDKEIARQVREINGRAREIEDAVWHVSNELELTEELRQRFIELISDRLDILNARFSNEVQAYAKTDKKAQFDQTAAGVLSYTMIDNVPHVLLSKRAGHQWWDNFGGESDNNDKYLMDTARREVKDESNGLLDYSEYELVARPCHDIITAKRERQFLYRMYIAEREYVDTALFKDHEHTEHQWVPVSDIVRAVKSKEVKVFEGQPVKVVQTESGDIPLFPPLCCMLEQQPVLEQLEMLCHSRPLKRRCTLSYAEKQDTEAKNLYRPLTTVYKKRQDLAVTMLKKNDVLKQIKRGRKLEEDQNPASPKNGNRLSPSELHMAAVLGDAYVANNVLANVELMINIYFKPITLADKRQGLIESCVRLIETEKENPDRFHFYHGCNRVVAFAYEVYSALYREIYANDARRAFRIDTAHLKKFNNIIDFIAHYSNRGNKPISDTDTDYHELAICTNVFLFGSHIADDECSLSYMLNNMVIRDFDLEYMLQQLFKPYHVSPQWVKRLNDLYVKYAQNREGTLYQIGVAKDDARSMSYPAGFFGVLNKLGDDGDITSVVATLITDAQDSKFSKERMKYIKSLQARLLVSPGLEMHVQEISDTDANHEQDLQLDAGLRQLMGELMYQSHLHAHMGNPSDQRGVCMFYPDTLKQNQIPHQKGLTDERLVAMILADDAVHLREVIKENPGILKRQVSIQNNNYIDGRYSSANNKKFSVFDLIIFKSGMKAAELGPDFENIALNHNPFNNDQFIQVMRKISPENRLAFTLKRIHDYHYEILFNHDDRVASSSIDDLANILALLPEKDRLKIYERYADRLPPFSDNIIKVFALLPDKARILFYENNKVYIRSCHQLKVALGVLPPCERMPTLTEYEYLLDATTEQIHTVRETLLDITALLPVNEKLEFAIRHQRLIQDSYMLVKLLKAMDADSCSRFLSTYGEKINDDCLLDILQCLPESKRYYFAHKHRNVINNSARASWDKVLETLPECDRYTYFKDNEHRLSSDQVVKILGFLPTKYYLDILKNCYKSCAKSSNDLEIEGNADYINSLPSSMKDPYIQFVRANIVNSSLDNTEDKLTQCKRLSYALHFTPETERMTLVKQFEASITTREELSDVGKMLDYKDCLLLVNRHLDLIHNGTDLYHVALMLTPESRLNFLLPFNRKHYNSIFSYVSLLPEHDRTTFLHSIIPDDDNVLIALLQSMPRIERLQCAIKYIALVKHSNDLQIILQTLNSNEDKLDLIAHINEHTASASVQKYVKTFIDGLSVADKHNLKTMQRKTDDTFKCSHLSETGLFGLSADREHHDTNMHDAFRNNNSTSGVK